MNIPSDLKYSNDHEWVRVDGETVTIGITDFAQGELGDVVFVELPSPGDSFDKGDVAGTIEAVKTVADIFLPVGGTVAEVNEQLEDNSDLINQDAFGEGWILKVTMSDSAELDDLLDAEGYKAVIS
ncbi:MAG: glycine cleavage system protein GcvH [Candidatus Marinimicrobia bacterium]|nr:glycine cleavage system protein GcvH [Candidatus Neomarinimicrobiota bacterium]MCF7851247.1 glycine cleavage system protein GcvH [Candidatus Neomarinimicrobiota bacterium]